LASEQFFEHSGGGATLEEQGTFVVLGKGAVDGAFVNG